MLITYAFWNGRNLLLGPRIDLVEPQNGATASKNPAVVGGIIKNASFISLNGRRVFTDNVGVLREKLVLYPGYNSVVIEAVDRFGQRTSKSIMVYWGGTLPSPEDHRVATSTELIENN